MFGIQELEEREFCYTPLVKVAEAHVARGYTDYLAQQEERIQDALAQGLVVVTDGFTVTTELDTYVTLGRSFVEAFYLLADAKAFVSGADLDSEEYGDVWSDYRIVMPEG